MTQDEIKEIIAKVYGVVWTNNAQLRDLTAFAKLVEEKSIQPYLPYKEKIEAMERAYDAHFKKAMEK